MAVFDTTTDHAAEGESARYARAVGERLRSVRRQRRLSLQAVENASDGEFKASVLGAYERGERSIAVLRLRRLAALYEVPVDVLLPDGARPNGQHEEPGRRQRRDGDGDSSQTQLADESGKVTIDLVKLARIDGPERLVLQRYIEMILAQRQSFKGQTITIRGEDVRAIGAFFRLTSQAMRDRLHELGLLVAT